jgi:hypothetical protein
VYGNVGDRNNLTAWNNGDALVQAVAENNNNTIVIVHSPGALIVESWIDHPNVTAVVWAGVPGNEAGHSISDVLYGDYNPSGRLPYTIAKSMDDYGAQITNGTGFLEVDYSEGLNVDYRHFDSVSFAFVFPRVRFADCLIGRCRASLCVRDFFRHD